MKIFNFVVTARRARPRVNVPATPIAEVVGEASVEFWDAFTFAGTPVATCNCGRTHFCSKSGDIEEAELANLIASAAASPKAFHSNDTDDSLALMDIGGGILVWGCPCKSAARYEAFLLRHQDQILEFFSAISKKQIEQLELTAAKLKRMVEVADASKTL